MLSRFLSPYLLVLSLLAVLGITGVTWATHSLPSSSAFFSPESTVAELMVNDLVKGEVKPLLFIDVRTPEDYGEDHIGDSPLIPLSTIEAGEAQDPIQQLIEAQRQTLHTDPIVVLYCTRGIRSARAQQWLAARGIQTYSLRGGIAAWRSVVSPEQEAALLTPLTAPVEPG